MRKFMDEAWKLDGGGSVDDEEGEEEEEEEWRGDKVFDARRRVLPPSTPDDDDGDADDADDVDDDVGTEKFTIIVEDEGMRRYVAK